MATAESAATAAHARSPLQRLEKPAAAAPDQLQAEAAESTAAATAAGGALAAANGAAAVARAAAEALVAPEATAAAVVNPSPGDPGSFGGPLISGGSH